MLKTFMDPNADFRVNARERIEARKAADLERAAAQQDKRAVRMSRKTLRGNRRAAKASMRAASLRNEAQR